MTEIFEGPIDAGRASEFARIGAPGYDDDVIVIVDAEIADQLGDLLERRQHAGDAVHLGAPAGARIGRDHRSLDVGLVAQLGLGDLVADVEDNHVFVAGLRLDPFGVDERFDLGGQSGGGEDSQRECQ